MTEAAVGGAASAQNNVASEGSPLSHAGVAGAGSSDNSRSERSDG